MTELPTAEHILRAQIAATGRRLYERGLIVAGDGNISARLDDGHILITPAGLCKGTLHPDDLVVISLDDALVRAAPGRRQSSERLLHLHVYRRRPDVRSCVHAHPPTAVAATMAGISLAEPLLPELILALGPVPTAPYALTGTAEMGEVIEPFLADHQAILLSHHGALTFGDTLEQASMRMEQVEHGARILLAAHSFGGAMPLPASRIAELEVLRARLSSPVART
jgi:L-fuculose-phosphate aldolase